MAQLGLDPDQMDALAAKMSTEAASIQDIQTQITTQVNSTWWQGPDAERFRGEWQSTHTTALRNVAGALDETARLLRAEAQQQRQASGA